MHEFEISSEVEDDGELLTLHTEIDGPSTTISRLELSDALKEKLVGEGLGESEIEELLNPKTLAERPQDDSYPLSCYYISTSHNTYLLSRQLLGTASSSVYAHVIANGARCVEIDVWDSEAGPIVTHGMTFSTTTPFQDVVQTIGQAVKEDSWPLMISLECHASDAVQVEMVKIMKEAWGDKLVDTAFEQFEMGVPPSELKGKILLIVEWYSETPEPGEEYEEAHHNIEPEHHSESVLQFLHFQKKTAEEKLKIIPELAALGVYAQSVKPKKDFLLSPDPAEPTHRFLNVSESAMPSIIPHHLPQLITRSSRRQFRIYPEGTRIESANYNPVPYWRGGAQICAQNWQRFDKGMQLTRAMFEGTGGWVLKPGALLGEYKKEGGEVVGKGKVTFSCEVLGVSGVPLTKPLTQGEDPQVYIMAQLFHADGDQKWRSATVPALISKSSDGEKTAVDVAFDSPQTIEWEFDSDKELTFLRFMVVHNVKLGGDVKLGVYSVNLALHEPGIQAFRLLNPKGEYTNAGLLVKTSLTARE